MAEQTIKPVVPITPPRDVVKKKKSDDSKKRSSKKHDREPDRHNKKGIIDTYA